MAKTPSEKLARALRANLKRRKQGQAPKDPAPPAPTPGDPQPGQAQNPA